MRRHNTIHIIQTRVKRKTTEAMAMKKTIRPTIVLLASRPDPIATMNGGWQSIAAVMARIGHDLHGETRSREETKKPVPNGATQI